MEKMRKNSGQALLIILLVMAVGLTIGLAVISRSVTDIGISRREEDSARVFSVAEAGIEEALRLGYAPSGGVEIGGIRATVTQSKIGNSPQFVFPDEYEAGDVQTLWLVEHGEQGNLDLNNRYRGGSVEVYWGKPGSTTIPALEVTLIYDRGGVKIMRWALDPASRGNNFEGAETGSFTVGGKTFKYRKTLSYLPCNTNVCYALRLRLLYNDQPQILGVDGGGIEFPSQGVYFESVASTNNLNEEEKITKKVGRWQLYSSPPGIFDYVLYSEGDLTKQ
jgi:hypothetical protein